MRKSEEIATPGSRVDIRWRRRYVAIVAVSLIAAGLGITAWVEAATVTAEREQFPAPGELFTVGNDTWHLQCDGPRSTTPIVVFEAGLGDSSATWTDLQAWDLAQIEAANRVIGSAAAARSPGPYQVQALITAAHANARTASDTDWAQIVKYYDMLTELDASPIVVLNRAVAVAMADGAPAGLRALDAISGLDTYHLYWATRGELLLRAGSPTNANAAFERALRLTPNAAERRHLEQRITAAS